MHSPTFPTSPLAIIHTTLVGSTLASTALLLALVFALTESVWSRAALALQAVALAVMGRARRRGPPRQIAIDALAGSAVVWGPTPPPAKPPEERVRYLPPLVVSVVVFAALEGTPAALHTPGRDPGGRSPVQSLRD